MEGQKIKEPIETKGVDDHLYTYFRGGGTQVSAIKASGDNKTQVKYLVIRKWAQDADIRINRF